VGSARRVRRSKTGTKPSGVNVPSPPKPSLRAGNTSDTGVVAGSRSRTNQRLTAEDDLVVRRGALQCRLALVAEVASPFRRWSTPSF
jgi:hypothetical protein